MNIAVRNLINEVENRDLLWISFDKNIPANYRGVSFVLDFDEYGRIKTKVVKNETPDPSTIWAYLPFRSGQYAKLPYWPHYIDLTPEQRYAYLSWLRNVEQPTDMGFVFLYYYGLERHLVLGDIDKAINQIIRLRNIHQNKSFLNYSESSIIHACLMRDRIDLLLNLHERTEISGFKNSQFYIAYQLGLELSPENLLDIFLKLYSKARKAIRGDRDNMLQFTTDSLMSVYGKSSFPIKGFDFSKVKKVNEVRFCNYSFPDEIRNVEVTDFYSSKPLLVAIDNIFNLAYEAYKKHSAIQRKLASSNLSENEILERERMKDLNRYKKLLNDKKITQEEFNLLSKHKEK